MDNFPILSVLVALPLVGALVVPALKGAQAKQAGLGYRRGHDHRHPFRTIAHRATSCRQYPHCAA